MGYSSRYHAASLAAVFLALAIGILIGVGFGDDVVSGTSRSLENSLKGDLEDARAEVDELNAELGKERDFGEAAYPALVDGRLEGDRVGLIAIGGLPSEISDDVEEALGPTGATLAEVAVVREPPDTQALAGNLQGTPFAKLDHDPEQLEAFGRAVGRQLVAGGRLLDDVREAQQEAIDRLEAGLLDGIRAGGSSVVGVEASDTADSSIQLFDSHDIPTSDSIDLVSGRVAAVFVLLGADGNFGTKDTADELLPDLLVPANSGR